MKLDAAKFAFRCCLYNIIMYLYIYMILYVFVVVAVKIKAKSKRIVLSVGNGVNWQDFSDEVFLFFVLIFRKTAKP